MVKQDCWSWSGCSDPGVDWACPALPILCSSGAVAPELSILPFHLWCAVELSPPPGCLGCVPWDSSVWDDFNMQLAESGSLSAAWEIILPRFTLSDIWFWGTEQKTLHSVWLLGVTPTIVFSQMLAYFLQVICYPTGSAVYFTWRNTVHSVRGVKSKERMDENIWDPIPCSGISVGMTGVAAHLSPKAGLFSFPNQPCKLLHILNWFFAYPAQMGC